MPIALGEGVSRCRAPQPEETPPQIVESWAEYKRSGSLAARNRLVTYYMRVLVRPIAIRVRAGLPHHVDVDDLIQQGYLGLIDAMDRFDIERDTRFQTFSRRRVFGAIQDYLRSIDPVPRLTRTRFKQVQALRERFQKEHGRPPTDEEIGPLLDLPEETARRCLADWSPVRIVPFSNVHPDGAGGDEHSGDAMLTFEDHDQPGPCTNAERIDLQRWLTRGLDQRDRLIVILYYYEQMTMHETGQTLGICESRVSQRLDSILARLRSRLLATGAEREFVFR